MVRVTIQVDKGKVHEFVAEGSSIVTTLLGKPIDLNAPPPPPRPSPVEFSANPKIADGVEGDLTMVALPGLWYDPKIDEEVLTGTYLRWSDWYRVDPDSSLRYWQQRFGAPLNLDELGANQKARMGK